MLLYISIIELSGLVAAPTGAWLYILAGCSSLSWGAVLINFELSDLFPAQKLKLRSCTGGGEVVGLGLCFSQTTLAGKTYGIKIETSITCKAQIQSLKININNLGLILNYLRSSVVAFKSLLKEQQILNILLGLIAHPRAVVEIKYHTTIFIRHRRCA